MKENRMNPPAWFNRLLEKFCNQKVLEDIQGDLLELYQERYEKRGKKNADFHYIIDVLRSLKSFGFYEKKIYSINSSGMLRNYLKTGLRVFSRYPQYSVINLLGLTIGLTGAILLLVYVKQELSYDDFHENRDRIFMVGQSFISEDLQIHNASSSNIAGPVLKRNFPEIEKFTRIYSPFKDNNIIKVGDEMYIERNVIFAGSDFFEIFTFPLIKGNPNSALEKPNSVILTQEIAEKYFGNEDPMNKILKIDGEDYEVTGLMKNVPVTSHFYFEIIGSFETFSASKQEHETWDSPNYYTYILTHENLKRQDFEEKIDILVQEETSEAYGKLGARLELHLLPLNEVHFSEKMADRELFKVTDRKLIMAFGAIGIIILLIACVNYVNLTTARAADRAREVGLKKVIGAKRSQLIMQFLIEAFIMSFIAVFLALAVIKISLPYFENISGKELLIFANWEWLIGIPFLIILVSLLAGIYPTITVTRFNATYFLKGNIQRAGGGSALRKTLVVFQFIISISLIIATLVISKQMQYMQNKNLGYNKEQVITLPSDGAINKKYDVLKNNFLTLPSVGSMTSVEKLPTNIPIGNGVFLDETYENMLTVGAFYTDQDFFETTGIKILKGRNFDKIRSADRKQAIVNERFLEKFNMTEEEVLGKIVYFWGKPTEIIGIMNNFHTASLHDPIEPVMAFNYPETIGRYIMIKVKSDNMQRTISALAQKWVDIIDHRPFDYEFLDQRYENLYKSEIRTGKLIRIFTFLALFIAVLGVYGLSSFSAVRKAKEISIRKVLGATVSSILVIFSKTYMQLLLVAFVIAAPIGYLIMLKWLDTFEFKIELDYGLILIAGFLGMIITLVTISYHSIKSALTNPADNLRNE